jgi:hypothetical protein
MTESDQRAEAEIWLPIPGATYYEASDLGRIRSVNRTIGGRFYEGRVLKLRPDPDGYLRVNITGDDRQRQYNVAVSRLVLMAHDTENFEAGLEACHGPGGRADNRLMNLRWDTSDANRQEALAVRLANTPPKPPKEPLRCVNYDRCGRHAGRGGRRCHPCVEEVGRRGALLLANDMDPEKAAEELDYASSIGLIRLAKKYGGLRFYIDGTAVSHTPSPTPWLRRVLNRTRPSRQNSDGA